MSWAFPFLIGGGILVAQCMPLLDTTHHMVLLRCGTIFLGLLLLNHLLAHNLPVYYLQDHRMVELTLVGVTMCIVSILRDQRLLYGLAFAALYAEACYSEEAILGVWGGVLMLHVHLSMNSP